jgi:hypothetical protein
LSIFPVSKTAKSIENKIVAETESEIERQVQIITKIGAISIAARLLNISSSKASSMYFSPAPITANARIIKI